MKIYIAGKITGLPESEFIPKFKQAETELQQAGWEPVNPCDFNLPPHTPSAEAMKVCIPELEKCQAIYMLSDWQDSLGAIIEHNTAKHLMLDRYYQDYHPFHIMHKIKMEVL